MASTRVINMFLRGEIESKSNWKEVVEQSTATRDALFSLRKFRPTSTEEAELGSIGSHYGST